MAVGKRAVPAEPHDLNDVFEAEQALVGLILADASVYDRVAGIIRGDDWTERLHRGVFEVAGELAAQGRAIALADLLPRVSDVGPDGDEAERYLVRLAARAPSVAAAAGLARLLAEAASERASDDRFPDYESDAYSWAFRQAERLRRGQWSQLDALNLAEEIEDLGAEIYNKLESALRVTLMHLLKWDHQPERRSRSWTLSIRINRIDIEVLLEKHPGLKGRVTGAITAAYRKARLEAAAETGVDDDAFPETCPYAFQDIMTRPVQWPPTA